MKEMHEWIKVLIVYFIEKEIKKQSKNVYFPKIVLISIDSKKLGT